MIYFNELNFVHSLFCQNVTFIYIYTFVCFLKWNQNSPSKDTSTWASAQKSPFELIIVKRP